MQQKTLLRIAAGLVLFTFLGHSAGGLMTPPTEELPLVGQMTQTTLAMPFGAPKTYWQVFRGGHICVSVFLFTSGILYILLSGAATESDPTIRRILRLNNGATMAVGVLSYLYFFPLPAACMVVAAVLGYVAGSRAEA